MGEESRAGEIITGVFCVSVGSPFVIAVGVASGFDGINRIYSSCNSLWTNHQAELYALQEWEQKSLKPAVQ